MQPGRQALRQREQGGVRGRRQYGLAARRLGGSGFGRGRSGKRCGIAGSGHPWRLQQAAEQVFSQADFQSSDLS